MVAGGVAWLVASLVNTGVTALVAAGLIAVTLPLAVVVHLLHAFPSGRLRGRRAGPRSTGYVVWLVLEAPDYLFGAPDPLQVADRPDSRRRRLWVQRAVARRGDGRDRVLLGRRLRARAARRSAGCWRRSPSTGSSRCCSIPLTAGIDEPAVGDARAG